MTFSHPLARAASLWRTGGANEKPQNVLVVITTLELDPAHKKYKADKVDRPADSARQWVADNSAQAGDYMLMNRARDW